MTASSSSTLTEDTPSPTPIDDATQTPPSRTEPRETELPAPVTKPYPGISWTKDGKAVGPDLMILTDSHFNCGYERLQLLTTGQPIGNTFMIDTEAMQFVRDPLHTVDGKAEVPFDPSTVLPSDATFTGYKYDDLELWSSESDNDIAVYIVRGPIVERWPRVPEAIACA